MAMEAGGVFSGMRKEETRGVYRPGASQAASPERRAYRNHGMGGKVVGDVQRGSGQWRMAVRPRACALRPHVAGLGVGGVSRP
jgi:predicted kinase